MPKSDELQKAHDWALRSAVDEMVQAALQDGLPPGLPAAEASTVAFLAGMTLMAKAMVMALPASDEKDFVAQARAFMDSRPTALPAAVIDVAVEVYRRVSEEIAT